jgi:hypothetical protein
MLLRSFGHIVATVLAVCSVAVVGGRGESQQKPKNEAKFENIKFSKEEIELLKRIKQIEDAAHVSASMLKTAPFIQLFSSPSPQELAITIFTNDWDEIGPALRGLGKAKACQVVKEIDLFSVDVVGEPEKNPNASFFSALRSRYDQGC